MKKGDYVFKKFLSGLVFGAGFGIAFVIVAVVFIMFFFKPMVERRFASSDQVIESPPSIQAPQKFLGTSAVYSSDFKDNKEGVLSKGPGKIVGQALVNNNPVPGLKLRLPLNGRVVSQWATTDEKGRYAISVPYGEYRIDGYELDSTTANRVLAGKIAHPQFPHSSDNFDVTKDSNGRGLVLRFVDPIKKKIPKKTFSESESVVINWAPYPGAHQYTIQVYEKTEPYSFTGGDTLFEWGDLPKTSDASLDLGKHEVKLRPGHFYVVNIVALDDRMAPISETDRKHSGYDFEITE